MFWKEVKQYSFFWFIGGSLYYFFEILFRGFSHISMFILGGICMDFFVFQGKISKWKEPIWKQVIRGTLFIISGEFITGIIVNKWLGLKVWDYSDQPLHLWGQICLPFAVIFSGLCAMGILLSGYLLCWIFHEEKPKFHVL